MTNARWTIEDMRAWCLGRDYRTLLIPGQGAPALAVAERFDWSGRPLEPGFRRVRVIGRQLYVLCRAAAGGSESARECAPRLAEMMLRHAVSPAGQFVSRLAPDGQVLDDTADLYDIAFGLFALAWWYRLSGDEQAIALAEISVEHLRHTMASPSGIGFVDRAGGSSANGAGGTPLHLQNPHMHLFEAALFLAAFSGKACFAKLADDLAILAREALFDRATGTLAESFDADWRPTPESCGRVRIEPGHHFEWAWLLESYALLSGRSEARLIARVLYDFAELHGCDARTGLVVDAVCQHGLPMGRDLRIWPNTERLKAQVAMAEAGADCTGAMARNVDAIHRHFLRPRPVGQGQVLADGAWIDYLREGGEVPKCDHVPASTLYHILFGFSEALRLEDGHPPFSVSAWNRNGALAVDSRGASTRRRVEAA